MKKILMGFLSFLMIVSLCGCSKKEPISVNDFKNMAENNNLTIIDVSEQFENMDDILISATVAKNMEDKWQIEFYELDSERNADKMFAYNKSLFESRSGSGAVKTSVELGNYSKFSLSNDNSYMYVSRVDNTLIYIDVDITHKDIVKNIIEELGY